MRSGWLEIELRSELCAANGDGTSGIVDTDIASEYGLPIIPAKRIKGCLREVGLELKSWGIEGDLNQLFGSTGQQYGGALHIQDAHLFQVPSTDKNFKVEDYENLRAQMKARSSQQHREMLDELTVLRTRTAIDPEVGSAADHTLRTMRVLPANLKLRSRIELADHHLPDPASIRDLEILLERCAKGLRSIGLGRTRGLGEVRCEVNWDEQSKEAHEVVPVSNQCSKSRTNDTVEVPFRLVLEQPVLIPGNGGLYHSSDSRIPGSVLLGALAGLYIAQHKLGAEAHRNADFARIFLEDGVKFGYAFPVVDEKVFAPCPASWQRVKNLNVAYDTAGKRGNISSRNEDELKLRSITSYVYQENDTIYKYDPDKEVRMHHSRPVDRNYGHPQGPDKGANKGQFFQYVSLRRGQVFQGTLQGTIQDLDILLDCVSRNKNRLRLGRSRTAEYGAVRFEAIETAAPILTAPADSSVGSSRLVLSLLSPLLLDRNGRAEADPQLLLDEINTVFNNEKDIVLLESRLKFGTLAGYNAKWRMPKPQLPVLEAGTTLLIETKTGQFSQEEIKQIEDMRWGAQTGEGCGRIKELEVPSDGKKFGLESYSAGPPSQKNEPTDPVLVELDSRVEAKRALQKRYTAGRTRAEQVDINLGQTKLRQLWELSQNLRDGESPIDKVKEMKDSSTKSKCEKIVRVRENDDWGSKEWVDGYFQALIWKARNQDEE